MAGHSKWANIKHKKAAVDAKRGKVFTKLIKELTVAARVGGGSDPEMNPKLRLAIDKANSHNMPKDTVERAIKRGSGEIEGINYEEVRYEGYGPNGVAVMIDCLTDKKIRTVAEIRHIFTKYGGNLGAVGSVSYLFKKIGIIFVEKKKEDIVVDLAIDSGAEDVVINENNIEILTTVDSFLDIKNSIEKKFLVEHAELTFKADNYIKVEGDIADKMQNFINSLELNEDVQDVYTNLFFEN